MEKAYNSIIVYGTMTIGGYSQNGNIFHKPIYDPLVETVTDYSTFPTMEGVRCWLLQDGTIVATDREIGYLVDWRWVRSRAVCEVEVTDISKEDYIVFKRKA